MEKHGLNLSLNEWEKEVVLHGHPAYRAKQIFSWLYGQKVNSFQAMGNLPQDLRDKLINKFSLQTLKVATKQTSVDGTQKWLFQTHDSHFIETVYIPDDDRHSICVSSQVGCAMGCRFCSTAKMGFIRNLSAGEILEQFLQVQNEISVHGKSLSNVIFMGMGEPMHNLENVASACDLLMDTKGLGLSARRITVSTSGLVNGIRKWAERSPKVKLAVSLNGSENPVRTNLMPINKAYSIEELFSAIDTYIQVTGQTPTIEFVLIAGKTCTPQEAKALRHWVSSRKVKVNLIPYNGGGDSDLLSPSAQEVEDFKCEVEKGAYAVMVRRPRGRDIAAACGQLAYLEKKVA